MRISRSKRWTWAWTLAATCVALSAGCASDTSNRGQLDAGETALRYGQYDQALRSADAAIRAGVGDNMAEAYYLRGKVFEIRQPKPDAAAVARDLAAARSNYTIGLSYHPSKSIEALLHGQLGNAEFYLDNYPAALHEWTIAYAQLEKPEWKQWVLYRTGICQQRLGRFIDADRTFELVQQLYPGSEAAARAATFHGVRGFYVQVGAFSQPSDAAAAISAITAVGAIPMRTTDKGLTVIRTQNVPSYEQAKSLKARLADRYPDASVMP